jgi:hypothetical protein
MGQLIFVCPRTGKTLRSSLDWLTVDFARSATVKIHCPYCFEVHDLPVQDASNLPTEQRAPDTPDTDTPDTADRVSGLAPDTARKKKPRRSGAVGRE